MFSSTNRTSVKKHSYYFPILKLSFTNILLMLNIFILYICLFTLVKDVSFYRFLRKVLKLLKSDGKYIL